jgi:chemotaxis-related protein WspB
MLFLLFQLGPDRYALPASQVIEVLPLIDLKQIPQAPRGVAGLFNCRGILVPVIDLSELTLNRAAPPRLSTRIILVHYADEKGEKHLLGLMAEKATETLRLEPKDFMTSGVTNEAVPYLGPVAAAADGLIQQIEVSKLLPVAVRDLLFKQPMENP